MAEFLAMGGHAAYVWPAWGLAVAVAVANTCLARRRLRQAAAAVRAARDTDR